MTHCAGLPKETTTNGTGLSHTSIGVEVEEALFLDEAEGHGGTARTEKLSPFDLFADEDELHPPSAETLLAAPSPARSSASSEQGWTSVLNPALGRPTVYATTELFGGHANSIGRRVKLVTLFFLVAAAMAFATVQACQVSRAETPSASSSER